MIYTVTLNPAVDKTVVIPGFSAGSVNRIQSVRQDAGGKGINVSKCLQSLGGESVAAVLLGGSSGAWIRERLGEQNLHLLTVDAEADTRTNLKIIDPVNRRNTDINEPGPAVTPEKLEQLRQRICAQLKSGDTVILSGSLPKGTPAALYGQWIALFRQTGARVILDADGEALKLAVKAEPCLIKPNDQELAGLTGMPMDTPAQIVAAAEKLRREGISEILVSRGEKGAIYLSDEGVFRADGLEVPVLSTVGAGDSMVAAIAYGYEKKLNAPDRLRLAVAMGSASVMCSGTQAPQGETVKQLLEQVHIQEV